MDDEIELKAYFLGRKADMVEVVRCKDCKHYHNGLCWNVMRRHGLEDDFFCRDGKRKDGDGDGI